MRCCRVVEVYVDVANDNALRVRRTAFKVCVLDKIETKFQKIPHVVGVQQYNETT